MYNEKRGIGKADSLKSFPGPGRPGILVGPALPPPLPTSGKGLIFRPLAKAFPRILPEEPNMC